MAQVSSVPSQKSVTGVFSEPDINLVHISTMFPYDSS
jgi:hypothetical protein